MDIRVLGPLRVEVDGATVIPSAPKPRQVLALFVLHADRLVTNTALIRELWADEPPMSAMTTLQTYILQLRRPLAKALGMSSAEVAQSVLLTQARGYTFRSQSGDFDLRRFEDLARCGRDALMAGQAEIAAAKLRQALDLWHGPALGDVVAGPLLQAEIARLEELRLATLGYRIEADLRIGRHRELVSELTALVRHHNLHEDLHAQLMLALYRSGRRSSALEAFRGLRQLLAEGLGLEPTVRTQRLHLAILSADPSIESVEEPWRLTMDRS